MKKLLLAVLFAALGFSSMTGPAAAADLLKKPPFVLKTPHTNPPYIKSYAVMLQCSFKVTPGAIAMATISVKNTTKMTLKAGTTVKYTVHPAVGPKVMKSAQLSADLAPQATTKLDTVLMNVKACYASVTFKAK